MSGGAGQSSLVCLPLLFLAGAAFAADALQSFDVNAERTSVSGLSSGAYMAGQFHVAFSGTVIGAGIVAGGPYDCAEGQLPVALNRCMQTSLGVPDPARLLERARAAAAEGDIDPLANLADDRVYVFSGTQDETVTPPVVAEVLAFYRLAGLPEEAVQFVDDIGAGHGFITEDRGNACDVTSSPFINDCDYDQAGAILAHVHGPLNPPSDEAGGTVVEFDQSEFLPDPTAHGMAPTGFAHVPDACVDGGCDVHIAFHGCRQTEALVGDAFHSRAGYNRWADANRLIVLYPQATATPANPNGCWDWWGYDDPGYATRSGRQMAAVRAMLARLAGDSEPPDPFCQVHTATNVGHWQAGRARICNWWFFCAVGSGETLGFALSTRRLFESPQGNFGITPCVEN
jgi:poly(3-hydroxybutyrate) depolymerase